MGQRDKQQLSDIEAAISILRQAGKAMYFRDLINEVFEVRGIRTRSAAQAMAEVHTQINMDSRFVHLGKGMWGLVEWVPQRGSKQVDEPAVADSVDSTRREKLFAEIQQDYVAATTELGESE